MHNLIFPQQMNRFMLLSNPNSPLTKNPYKNPLGEYTDNTLERLKWIKKEKARVGGVLQSPNYSFSRRMVVDAHLPLNELFIQKHLPRYLKHIRKRNTATVRDLMRTLRKGYIIQNGTYVQMSLKESSETVRIAEAYRLKTQLEHAFDQSRVIRRYCEYVTYTLLITDELRELCLDLKEDLKEDYADLVKDFPLYGDGLREANLWPEDSEGYTGCKTAVYQTSRVDEYADKINEWNARKAERWCKSSDQWCVPEKDENRGFLDLPNRG